MWMCKDKILQLKRKNEIKELHSQTLNKISKVQVPQNLQKI